MTEAEVISIVRRHIERQFPKSCTTCGVIFHDLADYLRNTTHLGTPTSYDAEIGEWTPRHPIGTVSVANCRCGTTLAIGSDGLGLWTMIRLLHWARKETRRRGVSIQELLRDIRDKIDAQVLSSGTG